MEMEIVLGVIAAIIAGIAFAIAYWKSSGFRNAVNAYVRKAWREYKTEVYQYADAHITDIMDEVGITIKKGTHKYIKNEVLRRAVDAKLTQGVGFTDEWVKINYKEVLQDLIDK